MSAWGFVLVGYAGTAVTLGVYVGMLLKRRRSLSGATEQDQP